MSLLARSVAPTRGQNVLPKPMAKSLGYSPLRMRSAATLALALSCFIRSTATARAKEAALVVCFTGVSTGEDSERGGTLWFSTQLSHVVRMCFIRCRVALRSLVSTSSAPGPNRNTDPFALLFKLSCPKISAVHAADSVFVFVFFPMVMRGVRGMSGFGEDMSRGNKTGGEGAELPGVRGDIGPVTVAPPDATDERQAAAEEAAAATAAAASSAAARCCRFRFYRPYRCRRSPPPSPPPPSPRLPLTASVSVDVGTLPSVPVG